MGCMSFATPDSAGSSSSWGETYSIRSAVSGCHPARAGPDWARFRAFRRSTAAPAPTTRAVCRSPVSRAECRGSRLPPRRRRQCRRRMSRRADRGAGALAIRNPGGVSRDRDQSRRIPALPAPDAAPVSARVDRALRQRRGGVTHRTDHGVILALSRHCSLCISAQTGCAVLNSAPSVRKR